MTTSPTVRLRRLSRLLVQLREQTGIGVEEATKRLEWGRGRLTNYEQNKWVRPSLEVIRALLDLYGVTDMEVREGALNLARQAREKGWWADYKDVFRGSLPGFEAEAAVIRTYEALVIPGLLQIPEYIAAVYRGGKVLDDSSIERRVKARLARQEILERRTPPELSVVIDEAALRKMIGGPDVMRQQLRHVVTMASRPNIHIQVLPDSVGAHSALLGSFVILDFRTDLDPSIVYLETATDNLYLETPEELHRYTLIYGQVQGSSLSPEESVRYLLDLMDQL